MNHSALSQVYCDVQLRNWEYQTEVVYQKTRQMSLYMYIKFCEPLCAFTGLLVTLMVTRKHGECRCTLKYLGAAVEQMKQIKYQCCEPFCAFTGLPFQVGTSNPNGLPGYTANAAVF